MLCGENQQKILVKLHFKNSFTNDKTLMLTGF